jgi:hypothetical protein
MASRFILLNDWLPRVRLQIPRPNQYCGFICDPSRNINLTSSESNAYVSGMETDLKLYGNELNYFTTFFKYVAHFSLYCSH